MTDRKETKPPTVTIDSEGEDDGPRMPRMATVALAVIVLGGALFYFWVAFFRNDSATWSNIGQAVGPFVALLNAGALFAALYSVRLQRYDLELQRQELRGHRQVMEEQRKQFERTAVAQEQLAAAQRDAANEQRESNRHAAAMRLAHHSSTIATLMAAAASLRFEQARIRATQGYVGDAMKESVDTLLAQIDERRAAELVWEEQLHDWISKGFGGQSRGKA